MLQVGMLWFDDTSDRTLERKIERAAEYYARKYGRPATVCYVHPSQLAGAPAPARPLRIVPVSDMLPHHFWLGVAGPEDEAAPRAA